METFVIVDYTKFAVIFSAIVGAPISQRALGRVRAGANREAVAFWHITYLDPHMQKGQQAKYNFQKRKEPYLGIKQALAEHGAININGQVITETVVDGGLVDNVRSGRTRTLTKSAIYTSTANKGQARMAAPPYTRHRRGAKPPTAIEITTTTIEERERVRMRLASSMRFHINRESEKVTKRL